MDYKKHYNIIIERAKNRKISEYTEKHHIVPKCIGGTDGKENLAKLTAREHFIAHILLIKIYPNIPKLIFAVNSMCRFNKRMDRSKNRMYGWLRELHAKSVSMINKEKQKGKKNSQYGTCWISHLEEEITKKIKKEELDKYLSLGWIKGRNKRKILCKECNNKFPPNGQKIFCCRECKIVSMTQKNRTIKKSNVVAKKFDIIYNDYLKYGSLCKAFNKSGVGTSGGVYNRFYKELEKRKND